MTLRRETQRPGSNKVPLLRLGRLDIIPRRQHDGGFLTTSGHHQRKKIRIADDKTFHLGVSGEEKEKASLDVQSSPPA